LRGSLEGTTLTSTYVFCREVVGYDLAAFFETHKDALRRDVESVLKGLLE
jgi:hypothetical protein